MGLEIKRIAVNFKWEIHHIWKGYINPYSPTPCRACNGSGYNKETERLSEDWYDLYGKGRKWSNKITQDEVNALIEHNRLMSFTHILSEDGWKKKKPKYVPTAEEVNKWSEEDLMGHDSINHWICVETRAKRLGVWGSCPLCKGEGYYFCDDKYNELYNDWERIEPPEGKGWQLWENVSEGSPISPVFKSPEELAHWLDKNETHYCKNLGYEEILNFVKNCTFSPSLVMQGEKLFTGIEAYNILDEK